MLIRIIIFITACKRSLGQGNVFTCLSFCPQGGVCIQGAWAGPPQILRDTVDERAVRILQECIFVYLVTTDRKEVLLNCSLIYPLH